MHFERGKKGIIVRFLTHVTIHFSMIKKIIDVAVMVSDAGAAAKWYNEKLGFKISSSDGHWVTVSPEGSQTVIHLCEGKLEPGNTGIAFSSDDVDRTYSELLSKGVEFSKKPGDDGFGKYAVIRDPSGNEFWLFGEM